MATKTVNLRIPEETLAKLKEDHAQSYPDHRKSFHAWLLGRICNHDNDN